MTAANTRTGVEPLRWLPAIPDALTDNPDWTTYLQTRYQGRRRLRRLHPPHRQ